LDKAGYETLPAKGVSEAIAVLREVEVRIDVLIVQCTLPGLMYSPANFAGCN
jgi:hypothetical protein